MMADTMQDLIAAAYGAFGWPLPRHQADRSPRPEEATVALWREPDGRIYWMMNSYSCFPVGMPQHERDAWYESQNPPWERGTKDTTP